jgi:hypothetical protein
MIDTTIVLWQPVVTRGPKRYWWSCNPTTSTPVPLIVGLLLTSMLNTTIGTGGTCEGAYRSCEETEETRERGGSGC